MNNNLTATVTIRDRASHILNRVRRNFERVNRPVEALTRTTSRLQTFMSRLGTTSTRTGASMQRAFKTTNRDALTLSQTLNRILGMYLLVQGAQALIGTSDAMTSAQNKLNYLNSQSLGEAGVVTNDDGTRSYSSATLNATSEDLDKMFNSAQKVRTNYADMVSNVSKSMTLASDAFGGNLDNAIRFQEIMAEAYTLGGASAQEMHSSMYQMIQALGSGILQGDELRSVREGAPLAYQKIEEFAQGVYNTEESLKDLASQGKITSEIVVAAMMNAGASIDDAFGMTNMTYAQAWTMIKNTATQAFRPVFDQLNEFLNSDQGRAAIEMVISLIHDLANVMYYIVLVTTTVIGFIAKHWDRLKYIFYSILAVLLAVIVVMGVLGTIAIISAIYAAAPWLVWIALGILAVGLTLAFLDVILGAFFWLCALIYNLIAGVVNGIIQLLWTVFAEPFLGILEWVLNAANGGFNSFGGMVANLIGQIISWFLSLGKVVTKIIDAIFGTNWTGGLEALQDKVLAWGKNDKAITISREAPEGMTRLDMTDAYNIGSDFGSSIQDKIGNFGSKIKNVDKSLGLTTTPTGSLGTDGTLEDIASDTSDISDAVALSSEDLEYLRKIAAMEWKKEYTTANIVVDMTNNNTINNENDLDGIVTTLSKKLREELGEVANGVYV